MNRVLNESLDDFVSINEIPLEDLAELAATENWNDIHCEPRYFSRGPLPKLKFYLKYTFARLVHENKLRLSKDGDWCAFNTGLLDFYDCEIYALLKKRKKAPLFEVYEFCVVDGPLAKRTSDDNKQDYSVGSDGAGADILKKKFRKLPEPAAYICDGFNVAYNLKAGKPDVDWPQFIQEYAARVDWEELFDVIASDDEREAFWRDFSEWRDVFMEAGLWCSDHDAFHGEDEIDRVQIEFQKVLTTHHELHSKVLDNFNQALDHALRLVRHNYQLATPVYLPALRKMGLVFPLGLANRLKPDIALIVEQRSESGYQALALVPWERWVYYHARLVAPQEVSALRNHVAAAMCSFEESLDDCDERDWVGRKIKALKSANIKTRRPPVSTRNSRSHQTC
jgi:Domain of unknown function (DUF3825)